MTGISRADRILLWLFGATVVMKLVILAGIGGGAFVGDEVYYVDSARALSNAVRDLLGLGPLDTGELQREVVGSGWFMPGMSALLTPLFLVAPDAPILLVRGYLALVSTLLLAAAAWRVRNTLGAAPAGALLVFPGLVPAFVAFGASAWGDADAGLLVVLLLCQAVDVVRTCREGGAPRAGQMLGLGLLAIACVYLRSSTTVVVLLVLGSAFVVCLALGAGRRGRIVVGNVVAGAVFLALLAPWSLVASAALDSRVVTTVSVPTVRANTFGDRDAVCFGECDPGSNIWFSPLRYSREVARAAGVSETVIADEMSGYARRDVTAGGYARTVGENVGRFAGKPARYVTLTAWVDSPYPVVRFAQVLTYPAFYAGMLVMLALLVVRTRRSFDDALLLLLVKAGLVALNVQPFVHVSGPRYWPTMGGLLGLGAVVLWRMWRTRGAAPAEPATTPGLTVMWRLQTGLSAVAITAVVVIGVLAALG